ncbi:ABC transporter ATP-binding protein [Schaalia suimastitidis]|uniref:ABC transporter ATP-binding protein n=1 Tax=Schaalia suimastitidis TaxID=121163 RepID=UPI00042670D1|nr:ABC transporter ATP-binding protein [Schaalia suimastitidis]
MRLPLASSQLTRKRIRDLIASHRKILSLVITLQLMASFAAVVLPWMVGRIVDGIVAGTSREWVYQQLAIILGLVSLYTVLAWFADRNARVFGERVFATLRENLVSTVVHLPLSSVESAGSGDLLGRTNHDVTNVQYLVRNGISSVLALLTTAVVTLGATALVAPALVWVLLAEIPMVVLVARWYLPRTVPAYRAAAAQAATLSGVLAETIEQGETVDAFGLARQRHSIFDSHVTQLWRLERYGAWMRLLLFLAMVVTTLLPILILIWLGAMWLPSGMVTAGTLTAAVMYCYQLRGPLWEATFWVDELQFSYTALQRIFGVEMVPADRATTHAQAGTGPLHADNVSYAYRDATPVLHGVTFSLIEGETLAIVGPSGAGKSTLGRMFAGIHPPTSGRIHSEGVSLVDIPEEQLRRKVALVTQEHHVFVGTLADNLRLARPDATDAQLWDALAAVGAYTWVRQDEAGLAMRVGSGGVDLPPARAQQVALARVALLDPEVVVLDEATSLLDPTSAHEAEAGLARLLEGRTVVAIAHRLDTAAGADRIAVMVDGRIVELGTHPDLVAAGGHYAHLWHMWNADEPA